MELMPPVRFSLSRCLAGLLLIAAGSQARAQASPDSPSRPAAAAASTSTAPLRALDIVQTFDLPAGPLATALTRIAADAGLIFSVDLTTVADERQPGVRGRMTVREAFGRLLAGTELHLILDGDVFTLERRPGSPQAAYRDGDRAALTLPEVRIRARSGGDPRYRIGSATQATRGDTPLEDLPQAVSVLSADLIRDQAPQSMADLLRYVPGLGAAQGEGNRDTPVFRGNLSTSDFLLDGLRDDVQYYRDLYNIDRVEVLRGPSASTVGHGAVGGLINRVSKVPRWRDAVEASVEVGTWDHQRGTVDLEHVLSPTLALRLNALSEDSDGYRDHFHLRRTGISPALAWRPTSRTLATLSFEHFQDHRTADRGIPSWQGRPLDVEASRFFGNPDVSTTWIRLNAATVQLDTELTPGVTLQYKARLADYDKFFQNAFPGSVRRDAATGGLQVSLLAHNSRMRRQNVFHQVDVPWTTQWGGIEHRWLAGAELGHQQGDNRRETGYFAASSTGAAPTTAIWVPIDASVSRVPLTFLHRASDPDNASELHLGALYLQDQITLSPAWQATLGLRHDDIRLDVDDHTLGQRLHSRDQLWSPRAGVIFKPTPPLSLYVNYSLGYALRAGDQLNVLTPASQDLSPERFDNIEAGAKWLPNRALELSLAAYQLDRRHVAVVDPSAPTQALLLVDGQRTRGLELSLTGQLTPDWQVTAAYTLQRSVVRESLSTLAPAGAWMPHVPRHSLSVWNRWALSSAWSAGLGVQMRSAVFTSTDNTVRLPGYGRLDAGLFFTPDASWRLQLNIENLLDRRYYAFAHSNNNITPGSPRDIRLGVHLKF